MLPKEGSTGIESVLVVEDDHALRLLFRALLRQEGYEADCVCDGEEAMEKLAASSYPVMVLDLMMPVMNGFDVLERLREQNPDQLRRTIIATGISERDLAKLDPKSVFAVLRKPFDIHHLIATISACAAQDEQPPQAQPAAQPQAPPEKRGDAGERSLDRSADRLQSSLPGLSKLLSSGAGSPEELLLRHELRQTASRLAEAFHLAALTTRDERSAVKFETVANDASRLTSKRVDPHRDN